MSAEACDDGMSLKPGAVITGNKGGYTIVKLLGEGGFGAVYRVQFTEKDGSVSEYAMKVEKKMEKRKHSKLKMEVAILKLVCEERKTGSHFTDIIDRGKKEHYFFLVMTLVGPSLDDMKRQRPHKVFSLATGLGAGLQCLEAVEDLHKHGFIHRDLKPANYARGLGIQRRIVYLLDFGIARRYLNDNEELKTPRSAVPFKGTVRFASRNCHRNKEMGPKDDCESWFYLLLDLIVPVGLPWKKMAERDDVLKCKDEIREDSEKRNNTFFYRIPCKDYLTKMLQYIDSRGYTDKVDYEFLYDGIKATASKSGVKLDAPYDWEVEGSNSATGKSGSKTNFSSIKSTKSSLKKAPTKTLKSKFTQSKTTSNTK
ncbi:unnamed protein product [Bursaphelenchus xylophilus]|uniref:(pine wood nematode) hypothetical protein n=1 Tax=Bursaphelenchus xylophilus TaxID=6326 RepID=A0A1I7SLI9_BURXY|nr:unnamed protein product [Bursaphelenchus xylophilus]CAG9129629.1 unnamed protein product [Bursaphelenchus xylophilus]